MPPLAEALEPRAKPFGEKLRVFKGREMAAFLNLIVVDQVGVGLFRPLSRSPIHLVRERTHSRRDSYAPGAEIAQLVFPIETR